METRGDLELAPITDATSPDMSEDPWWLVAELKNLASLAADIADALSQSLDLRHNLHLCADALVRGLDAAFARIWTLNSKENVLELQASAGLYTHLDGSHSRIAIGQFKIGLIAQERRPHLTNSVIGDPRIGDQEWARREGMVAFAGYPLLCDGRVVGVMALFARQPLTPATLHALATVADSIARGIAHCRAVEALRSSEERFALAVRGTEEGIWDWNVVTNEVYLADRFKELLGYEPHELESSYAMWESRLHPDDRDRVLEALRGHLELRSPYQVDHRLRTKSGAYQWFHARGQALWDDAGRASRMLGSIRDISARKSSEARLATVHQITRILAETTELSESLPRVLLSLCEHLNWGVGEFWERDRKHEVLRLAAFRHLPSVSVPNFAAASFDRTFKRGAGLPGRTWASARPEWIEDVTRDANFPRAAAAAQDNLHGAIAFPILSGGEVFGVMEFFNSCLLKPDEELLNTLCDISLQISRCIELRHEQEVIRRHRQELAIARQIQQHTFPKVMPVLDGAEIAGDSEPATEAGGDYFDFIPLDNGQLLFAVGDVSGHGLGPALVLAGARAYVRALASMNTPIHTIMRLVNERLVDDACEKFMTMFLGLLDPVRCTVTYCNAGHCPGSVLDARGEVRALLTASNLPLGIEAHYPYQNSGAIQILSGDILLVHSDGIPEASAPDGEIFGMSRVLDTIRGSRHLAPGTIIANLLHAARSHTHSDPLDDMTAVVVKATSVAAAGR